jgi:predicted amidophosphoribosyltransferase
VRRQGSRFLPRVCGQCGATAATADARYCHLCGTALPPPAGSP